MSKYDNDPRVRSVPEALEEAAGIYRQRNAIYGDNYKNIGAIMRAMFPGPVTLKTEHDFRRYGVFFRMMDKMTRYAENFESGGHKDSMDDIAVYAMILQELDDIAALEKADEAAPGFDL